MVLELDDATNLIPPLPYRLFVPNRVGSLANATEPAAAEGDPVSKPLDSLLGGCFGD